MCSFRPLAAELRSSVCFNKPVILCPRAFSSQIQSRRQQILDVSQANKMQSTLRHFGLFPTPVLQIGDALPPCYHFAYFTPDHIAEDELGRDGADLTLSPDPALTRRMWAGGRFEWTLNNPLRIGQEVEEVTSLSVIDKKRTREGRPLVIVSVNKEFYNDRGCALKEQRNWLYREPVAAAVSGPAKPGNGVPPDLHDLKGTNEADSTSLGEFAASETALFRFSAVTFNSHKIHLDRDWCREQEGQRDLVVHAPLYVTMVARVLEQQQSAQQRLSSLAYKAISPCLVHERCRISVDQDQSAVYCTKPNGQAIMKGTFSTQDVEA